MANLDDGDRLGDLVEVLIQAKSLADRQGDDQLSLLVVRVLLRTGYLIARKLSSHEAMIASGSFCGGKIIDLSLGFESRRPRSPRTGDGFYDESLGILERGFHE